MNLGLGHAVALLGSLVAAMTTFACETGAPTLAVIDNAYPARANDAGTQSVVYRAWWSVTYFAEPVPAGGESDPNRVIPATDYAYAVLAPDWDPMSGLAPRKLLPLRTKSKLSATRGETLHVVVSDATAMGNCAANQPLTQEEADLITQSIFPAEFAGWAYDAATCAATPSVDGDGGPAVADAEAGPSETGVPGAAPGSDP